MKVRSIHNLVEGKMQLIIFSPIINIHGKANIGQCGKQIMVKYALETNNHRQKQIQSFKLLNFVFFLLDKITLLSDFPYFKIVEILSSTVWF